MANVLVIEDDPETAVQIAEELRSHGLAVVHVGDGAVGIEHALHEAYDVITLDRLLPGGLDGLSVVQTLRQKGIGTPVLILSALGELDERVRGLRAGGDDYLVKPFAFAELRARVDALLRRAPERRTMLRVADLELDLLARTARRGRRLLDLLPREFRLLEYLVRHEGQVVTRAMLFEQVWNYRFDPRTNLVDVHVGRLRRKLDGTGELALLLTVKGEGFLFRAPA